MKDIIGLCSLFFVTVRFKKTRSYSFLHFRGALHLWLLATLLIASAHNGLAQVIPHLFPGRFQYETGWSQTSATPSFDYINSDPTICYVDGTRHFSNTYSNPVFGFSFPRSYTSLQALSQELGGGIPYNVQNASGSTIAGSMPIQFHPANHVATFLNFQEISSANRNLPITVRFSAPALDPYEQVPGGPIFVVGRNYVQSVRLERVTEDGQTVILKNFSQGESYETTIPAGAFPASDRELRISVAGTVYAVSLPAGFTYNNWTLHTRIGSQSSPTGSISGRILDRVSKQPINAATVSFSGTSIISNSNGSFSLSNVALAAGGELTVSAVGFTLASRQLSPTPLAKSIDLGDILLVGATDAPVIEWLKPEDALVYLPEMGILTEVSARVNWNGHAPGNVYFTVNDKLAANKTGNGPEYTITFPGDSFLIPSLMAKSNRIAVRAIASDGVGSEPLINELSVIPLPESLRPFVDPNNVEIEGGTIRLKFAFPEPALDQRVGLPVFGDVGAEFQAAVVLSYHPASGEFEIHAGGGKTGTGAGLQNRANVILGDYRGSFMTDFFTKGTAGVGRGFVINHFGGTLSLAAKFPLPPVSLVDMVYPGAIHALDLYPPAQRVISLVSIQPTLRPQLSGSVLFSTDTKFSLTSLVLEGKVGVEAAYKTKLWGLGINAYVGGEPAIAFQYPGSFPGNFFKKFNFRVYGGIEWTYNGLRFTAPEYDFVNFTYPGVAGLNRTSLVRKVADSYSGKWEPMPRIWRQRGKERFAMRSPANPAAVPLAPLGQLISPIIENIIPEAHPALAVSAGKRMLVYVRDSGSIHPTQFTEIAYTYYDGTSWSTPRAVAPGPNGQFSPQVMFDGAGDAIVVWQQIKNATFSGSEIPALAAELEIVWARWNATTGTWSPPAALTNNSYLDHTPQLAGKLANGDLLLTWTQNESNQLVGTGPPGGATNSRAVCARWDSASGVWNTPQVIVPNLTGELSQSLAAGGSQAIYLWTRDIDGDWSNMGDTEVFFRTYDADLGVWGAEVRHTNDTMPDQNARVALTSDNHSYFVWKRGEDLVVSRDLGAPTLVRPAIGDLGFTDFILSAGPFGHLLLSWQQMNGGASDAYCRIFDPASSTWGLDTAITSTPELENSFAPAWDFAGNLLFAFCSTAIIHETKTVTTANGEVVTIDGVPSPGPASLKVEQKMLIADLSVPTDGILASGTDFRPGDVVSLHARLRNNGDVAVAEPTVSFYDGDPTAGGVLIQTVEVNGFLVASDEYNAEVNWTVPAPPGEHTIYVVADPGNQVTEFDEANNRGSILLRATQLELSYKSGVVARDGSARIVATVRNLGAPDSLATTLQLWPKDDAVFDPLLTVNVPILSAGTSVDLPLELPVGSHPEGEKSYRFVLGGTETLFSLNLFIDDDNDGLPRYWELGNGLNDADGSDASADTDHDGFSNRQEFLAGTDPRNAASYLRFVDFQVGGRPNGGKAVTFSWESFQGHIYSVERSFDLGVWETLDGQIAAHPPLNTYTEAIPQDGKVFYRLRAR